MLVLDWPSHRLLLEQTDEGVLVTEIEVPEDMAA